MAALIRRLPFVLIVAWFLLRLGVGMSSSYDLDRGRTTGVMSNLLFILLVIIVALVNRYKQQGGQRLSFMQELKQTLSRSMLYVVGVVGSMWLYYGVISNELDVRRGNDKAMNASLLDTPEKVAAIKAENPALKDFTTEQILQAANQRTELMTGLGFTVGSAFLALTLVSIVYTLLGVVLFRNFLYNQRQ